MSSLHTKHRPATFDDVIGQDVAVKSLKRVVKDERAKAFILTGPSGTGKTTLARILANAYAKGVGTIANIQEIDAASSNKKEDMRALVAQAQYRALGKSPVKAIILDEAHALTADAWKVLLKPVEEPSSHVYWFFCTTEAAKIPKTIATRCMRYDLKPVSEDDLLKLLVQVVEAEKFDTSDEVLEAIAEGAQGSPRQALVYLEQCLYCETASEARNVMRSAGQTKEIVDLCRWLLKGRGMAWTEATKYVKALEGQEAESIRIVIVNYIGAALLGAKGDNQARALLLLLECFKTPYQQSDRLAPLLYSVGMAIGLDR